MKTSQLPIYLSLLFCFLLNTAMITPNTQLTSQPNTAQESTLKPTQKKKKRFRKFQKVKNKVLKRLRKITGVEDGSTMLIGIAAVILGGILVYYLFQLGFVVGLLAIVAVTFFLYLLFRYLNY